MQDLISEDDLQLLEKWFNSILADNRKWKTMTTATGTAQHTPGRPPVRKTEQTTQGTTPKPENGILASPRSRKNDHCQSQSRRAWNRQRNELFVALRRTGLTVIFLERPITCDHIRDVCARFSEGLRVEYKATFDASVRTQLPKIVSSFANSQGGVLVVGVRAANGVPQPPIEGFVPAAREEFPLTVENICLQNINPPVLPRTAVVQSDVANHVFLVIGTDESAEAPQAIENSTKVYVRTGNASNPYELAEVDLIVDLLQRRREPLEKRDRLLSLAEQRSHQVVSRALPWVQVSVCPQFPPDAAVLLR